MVSSDWLPTYLIPQTDSDHLELDWESVEADVSPPVQVDGFNWYVGLATRCAAGMKTFIATTPIQGVVIVPE